MPLKSSPMWFDIATSPFFNVYFNVDDPGGLAISSPEQETPAPDPNSGEKKFTQADVDRMVGEARTAAKKVVQKTILEELGVESVDTLKAALKSLKDAEDAKKSELQKVDEARQKLETDLETERKARQQLETNVRQERLESEAFKAIRSAGAQDDDAKDVFTLLKAENKLADAMNEDGSVDGKKLETVVTTFKSQKPKYFKPAAPGSPSNHGGRSPQPADAGKVLKKVSY